MDNHSENTKRIAKNTLMLYGRMLFSMVVSLYTTRVVLKTLGVEDYGIHNVVGGVVGMMDFLNASMSGATSRFITYELGRGNPQRLKETFSSAMLIHIGIALTIFCFAETIGLWFVENTLEIPENRMNAARVVYQLSILSMIIGITQVPYTACITSHEKFDIYAYFSIIDIVLRLLIVFLLQLWDYDKLILYSILTICVSTFSICINRVYCIRNFKEARFTFVWKKELLKPMLSFSGWDLFGNISVTARTVGVNMLINVFFGPIFNAAAGIATQVQGAIMKIASNLITASRPQIVKQYASENPKAMFETTFVATKIAFFLLAVFSIPVITEIKYILSIWLDGEIPQHTNIFCLYTLLFNLFVCFSMLLAAIIHATGRIKRISLINGLLYISVIPVSYIAYILGAPSYFPYIYNAIAVFVGVLSNAWTIKLYIPSFHFRYYITNILSKCIILFLIDWAATSFLFNNLSEGFGRFLLRGTFSTLFLSIIGYYFLLTKQQQNTITRFIKNRICKRH